jgi:hypothetical protein
MSSNVYEKLNSFHLGTHNLYSCTTFKHFEHLKQLNLFLIMLPPSLLILLGDFKTHGYI